MKTKILMFAFFAMFSTFVGPKAFAAPSMCVIEQSNGRLASLEFENEIEAMIWEAAYTCQELDRVALGIDTAQLVVQAGSLISACTGAGAPVAISLQAGALVLQTVKVVVKNMPCEDVNERKIEAHVKQFVCEQFADRGVTRCL